MKKLVALVLAVVLLSPVAAFAGSATNAALGLGAFAVFNQILGGVGVFGGIARPAPVYAPAQVVYAPPAPVVVAPAPVVVAPAPVIVAAPRVVVAPAPVIVARPVIVAHRPIYRAPVRIYSAHPPVVYRHW